MNFITNLDDPVPPPDPATDPDRPIVNDWFPDIDPAAVRVAHRIRDAVTAARLREALIAAIITVGTDVAVTTWQNARAAEGHAALADVPSPQIDGVSRLVLSYRRAVALHAKAEIVERYRDIDITTGGDRGADALEPSVGELRRDATHAIRDMLGRGRTTVELI